MDGGKPGTAGNTALTLALDGTPHAGKELVALALIAAGANTRTLSSGNDTPLTLAVSMGSLEVCEALVSNDPLRESRDRALVKLCRRGPHGMQTARQIAISSGNQAIAMFLADAEAALEVGVHDGGDGANNRRGGDGDRADSPIYI